MENKEPTVVKQHKPTRKCQKSLCAKVTLIAFSALVIIGGGMAVAAGDL